LTWVNRLASEATSAHKLIDHLDQAVLAKAFRGELVPQDPNDEPASVLLERIRAERAATPAKVKRRPRQVQTRTRRGAPQRMQYLPLSRQPAGHRPFLEIAAGALSDPGTQ